MVLEKPHTHGFSLSPCPPQFNQRGIYNILFVLFVRAFSRWLPGDSPPIVPSPILRMRFSDDDSLSLAGLDAPDFIQFDNSFSSSVSFSSLTAHCHSSCATSTCMRDPTRRSQKRPQPSPVITAEVRIDIHLKPPISFSPPPRIILLLPIAAVTSSNLFHLFQKFLHSTSRSSGTSALILPLFSTCHTQSSLEIPHCTIPRSAPQMVTMSVMAPLLWGSPNPQGPSTSALTHILHGQVQSDGSSCHARMALSRWSAGIHDRSQGVAPELLILPAVAQVLEPSGAMSQAFAGFIGLLGTFVFLRSECILSELYCERLTAAGP